MIPFSGLFADIAAWQREKFPHATPASTLVHLRHEIEHELRVDPTNGPEQADILILLIQLADRSGNNLLDEVYAKFVLNQGRSWQAPDADGVVEHIR